MYVHIIMIIYECEHTKKGYMYYKHIYTYIFSYTYVYIYIYIHIYIYPHVPVFL
jgi:hypothetical protein